jgi:general stress protein 26
MSQDHHLSQHEKAQHLHDLIKDFDTAMLVTHTPEGGLHARPLTVAAARGDGLLYFSTNVESPKVAEIDSDTTVAVTFQDESRYVAVTGTAELSRDRALIDELWNETWKVWFPKGKDDPSLAIIRVTPTTGEYWDQTGLKGVRYLFDSVKAYATGTSPPEKTDDRRNAKVQL